MMKLKDLFRTLGTGLMAASLCLTMTTACFEEDPTEDGTEDNGGNNETPLDY